MKSLAAESFMSDPRIGQARQLILDSLADAQKSLIGVKPADPERKQTYEQAIKEMCQLRGGGLFYPYLGSGLGNGALVELADGSVKYDLISGIGVHWMGHSHPDMVKASFDAALQDTIMQGNLQQNTDSFELIDRFVKLAQKNGSKLEHCYLSTSGAMANENALKIALQKNHPRQRVLAFSRCFAGRTLAVSQITDNAAYRQGLPSVIDVDYVPFFNPDQPEKSIEHSVKVLKRLIERYPDQHAVMCMELIQGEGGYYSGDRDFFIALIDVLKENNIAVMFDEIQTFGRTTQPFAFQHFSLDEYADIVTVGKMSQVCATIYVDNYKPKPGLISQTFTGGTGAIWAANAILKELNEGHIFGDDGKIVQVHNAFVSEFEKINEKHPDLISGPFGIGGMIAFTPFGGDGAKVKEFITTLFNEGVIGFPCGTSPRRVRFLPPIGSITEDDIKKSCEIIEAILLKIA